MAAPSPPTSLATDMKNRLALLSFTVDWETYTRVRNPSTVVVQKQATQHALHVVHQADAAAGVPLIGERLCIRDRHARRAERTAALENPVPRRGADLDVGDLGRRRTSAVDDDGARIGTADEMKCG